MSSIIKVDQIQTAAGGTPTAADLGLNVTGQILQRANVSVTNELSANTSSYANWSGMSITLTAVGSNSTFLCVVNPYRAILLVNSGNANMFVRVSDGTNNKTWRVYQYNEAYHQSLNPSFVGEVTTSHTAGSSVTFNVQGRSDGTGNNLLLGDNGAPSTFTIYEIAG